jgi:hypothetical protein
MAFKTASTRRTTTTSAVSSQVVIANTGDVANATFSAVGGTVSANTSISLGVTTVGTTTAASAVTTPVITRIDYLDANNAVVPTQLAVSTAGNGNILISGTGFGQTSLVYINNTLATNTWISSTQIRATCPAASSGNVNLTIFNLLNQGTIRANGIRYSGIPSWTTAAIQVTNGTTSNISLVATSDSTLTYTLQAGSTLPTGLSLITSGYISGTTTGYSSTTAVSVVLVATDAEGQATQQTVSFTIAVNDPYFKYTTLALNGEANTTPFISDTSTNNLPLTISGDTKPVSFNPYTPGYYSVNFPNNATLATGSVSALALGTGDYTIECWVMPQVISDALCVFITSASSAFSAPVGFLLRFGGTTSWQLIVGNGTSDQYNVTAAFSTYGGAIGVWTHHAIVRSSGTLRWYINGVQAYSVADSTAMNQTYLGFGNYAGYYWNGYISNFRMVKGTGVYTSAFTPPTSPLTAIANTSILVLQSNRLIDSSTNAIALTPVGGLQVSSAVPFTKNPSYSTYGSAYFDGTGDYLTFTNPVALGSGSFTIEMWLNPAVTPSVNFWIYGYRNGADTSPYVFMDSSRSIRFGGDVTTYMTGTSVLPLNGWTHVAIVRNGTAMAIYTNGISVASATVSQNFSYTGFNGIGQAQGGGSPYSWSGYISDFRIVVGTAVYTSNFTPPTSPLTAITNTSLLTLQYNGGANNYGIVDNSNFNNPITRSGNAIQGSFSPYSNTGWSNYFDGSGNYITSASSTNNALGSGDFTIEFWCYSNDLGVGNAGAAFYVDASGYQQIIRHNGAVWECYYKSGTAFTTVSTSTIPINQWTHHALVRNSGTIKWYINGVQYGSAADSTNYTVSTFFTIGNFGSGAYNGYVSNARVVKGTAVYTAAFTPPISPLTAISGTVFLSAQSNRFIDNSPLGNAFTLTGVPSVQTFSPFAPSAAYTPSVHGGSMYLDGTGDYLDLPAGTTGQFGTAPFTIEFWTYGTDSATTMIFQNSASIPNWAIIIVSGSLYWQNGYAASSLYYIATSSLTTNPLVNAWTHIAITRDASNILKWWINGVGQTAYGADTNNYSSTSAIKIGSGSYGEHTGYLSDIRITKGVAVYTSNFTPPTQALGNYSTTYPASLLLNFNTGGMIDQHSTNMLETVSGAQLSTAVKKYNNSSMSFNNSTQYLTIRPTATLEFGSGDFTIEFWWYPTATGRQALYHGSVGTDWSIGIDYSGVNTNKIGIWASSNGSSWNLINSDPGGNGIGTTTPTQSSWNHIAYVRSGTTWMLFVNGNRDLNLTGISGSIVNRATSQKVIGSWWNTTAMGQISGYLDDFRITKGFARYTANFTPTGPNLLL